MDGDTGLTLFDPGEIKLNIIGNEEEDEEALEEQKRRDEALKAQLENAFDDWSDDDETGIDRDKKQTTSPKSSTDDDDEINPTNDKDGVRNKLIMPKVSSRVVSGKIIHNLSDISERSINKSDCHSSENSGVFSSGTEQSPSSDQFPSLLEQKTNMMNENQLIFQNNSKGKKDKKFIPLLGKPPLVSSHENYVRAALDRRGSFEKQNKPKFKNIPYSKNDDKFIPLFAKSPPIVQSPGNEEGFRQAAMDGSGDFERRSQNGFKTTFNDQSNERFEPFFVKTPSVEQSLDESEDAYKQAELSSENQLHVLYQIRLKEIQRLNSQLEAERKEAAAYKQQTMMQNALLQSEKERAVLSRTEADKLLVASKEEISNFQKEVDILKQTLHTVEKEKKQSEEKLEMSRVEIQELEDRMALMERCDSSMRLSKQTNLMVKNLKSKHQEEISLLQGQLETVTAKLQEKEEESRSLEQRLDQLTVEKAATISQLTRSLEDSQRQCQQLLETNVMVENVTLNHQLNQVLLERDQLTQTVNSLREECRTMKSELDTVSPTDSMVHMGISQSRARSTDTSTNLQAELHRALLNQKAKRAEVVRLQNIVSDKEKEIEEIKGQQQILLADKEALDDELKHVKEDLNSLRSKYEELKRTCLNIEDKTPTLQENKQCSSSEMKEADLKLKEASVRLEQNLREVKELKEVYLGVTTELGMLKSQLQQVTEERDRVNVQLQASLNQVNVLQKENNELLLEISNLKDQDNMQKGEEEQLRAECASLQNELSTMSARHTQELSSARSELQAARDRVSQLEKTARLQFETKIKALLQECDMLKTKCDEKEVQIKKLIESRKRVPSMTSVATETDKEVDRQERLEKELSHCQKEYEATLAFMEKVHQDVVETLQKKHLEDKENLHQAHLQAIADLEQQLVIIEEQTKEKTIHFFSEKVQELELKYQEELKKISNPSEVVRLKIEVADQSRQIEILSESLERANEAVRTRMKELAIEREADRRHLALLMEQWSQEITFAQEENKSKDENIKQLKLKLESAKYCAKTNHDKLVKTNKELIDSMNNKLAGYRSKVKANIESYEKDVWDKVQKIESVYRRREKRLHQEFKKQLMVDL